MAETTNGTTPFGTLAASLTCRRDRSRDAYWLLRRVLGLGVMPVRYIRAMTGLLVLTTFVLLGGRFVMFRGMFMMFSSFAVMFRGFL